MQKVNITELRSNLPRYLAHVRRGREMQITHRGKVKIGRDTSELQSPY